MRVQAAALFLLCAQPFAALAQSEASAPETAQPTAGAADAGWSDPAGPDAGSEPAPPSPDAGQPAASWDIAEIDLAALLEQDVRAAKVSVASKREETVGDAPATITVLTHEDFARHDWRTVAEALRAVPGLYVSWGRDYFHTGVRGLSFPGDTDTRILVLIDGHPMNSAWNASSNLGEVLALTPGALERVEIVRGPASSVYGSNAFLAVVNIVTRAPTEKDPSRLWFDALATTANAYRLSLAGHHQFGFGLVVSGFGTLLTGDGPPVHFEDMTRPRLSLGAPTPTLGLTRGTDFERGGSAGVSLSFKGLTLSGQIRHRWKGLPTAPGGALFDDPYNSTVDRHAMVELKYGATLGPVGLNVRAAWDRFRSRRTLHLDPTDWEPDTWKNGDVRLVSEGLADRWGGELQGTIHAHEKDTITVGAEVTGAVVSQPSYELDPATGEPDEATLAGGLKNDRGQLLPVQPVNVGAYVQNDWRPLRQLGVVLGLRFDYNTIFFRTEAPASALAPRAAVVFKPVDAATLKLSYGEAFRYPTPFEAFFDDQGSVCGNSNARPERQRTVELAGVVNVFKGYNLSASAYWTQLQGLLVRQPINPCYAGSGPRQQFANAGEVMVFGGEAAVDVRLQAVNAFANVAVNHAVQTLGASSSRPANSPTVVAGAGAALPVLDDRVFVSARAHLVSGRLNWTLDRAQAAGAALRLEASLTGRKLPLGLLGGLTAIAAFKLTEPNPAFEDWAPRDPVTGAETVASAVPQNTVEVRAHVGFEL